MYNVGVSQDERTVSITATDTASGETHKVKTKSPAALVAGKSAKERKQFYEQVSGLMREQILLVALTLHFAAAREARVPPSR